jgi:hypothetical protein
MEMAPEFSSEAVRALVRDTLRHFVGHGRTISWAALAAATFDGEGSIDTWERRLRSYVEVDGPMMPLNTAMRIFSALPPAAFQRLANRMGFVTAPLHFEATATVRTAVAACARFAANGAEALEDGSLSHVKLARLAHDAIALGPIINSIAGSGSALR